MTEQPTTRARQKAETRARILDAAIEVFTGRSVIATPMDAVAEAAGVSKASLFFHFGSRIDLLEEIGAYIYFGQLEKQVEIGPETDIRTFAAFALGLQRLPTSRLLWEIGDILSAEGRPGPDLVYSHQIEDWRKRLRKNALTPQRADDLARVLLPAAMLVGRRVAFGQADQAEVDAFCDGVERVAAQARGKTGKT